MAKKRKVKEPEKKWYEKVREIIDIASSEIDSLDDLVAQAKSDFEDVLLKIQANDETLDPDEIYSVLDEARESALSVESAGSTLYSYLRDARMVVAEEQERRGPPNDDTLKRVIIVEPDYDRLKEYFQHMKDTDKEAYRRVLLADETGQTARWLGEPWPLPKGKK